MPNVLEIINVNCHLCASSLDEPYYYCNNCNNKQNMNDATRVKREKPN